VTAITHVIGIALAPFLLVTGTLLFALVCHVLVLHGLDDMRTRRRDRVTAVYRPLVAAALQPDCPDDVLVRLQKAPRRDRAVIASLLLEPLGIAEGLLTERARAVASALGYLPQWLNELGHARPWVRANAAFSLGLVQAPEAATPLIAALDDPYEEVRAAAIDALGLIRPPEAVSALIARFRDQSRHQRVRLVQALRQFQSAAVAPLLEHASKNADDLAAVADLLGDLEATSALDHLVEWSGHERSEVRAGALRAIGVIGVDDRAYYHLLRALSDDDAEVRAAAASALGRSGRPEAAAYVAEHLHDDWIVAAQSARALRDLGVAGRRALEAAAALPGGELARQMLWECGAGTAA
jgi:HEAT repeat protein